jgi:hypothetical protein
MTWCEIVRIESPVLLVSSRHNACHYETPDGGPLAPGHYLVLWPTGAKRSHYGRECRYFGPFATMAAARLAQTSALGLGIVNLEVYGSQPPTSPGHAVPPEFLAYGALRSMVHPGGSPMQAAPGDERVRRGD